MSQTLTKTKIKNFQNTIWKFYKSHKRMLPWRVTRDPYAIVVSEFMLQQTQVARVIQKYELFLKRFPTWDRLSGAAYTDVYAMWQGLGYNRRAKFLRDLAVVVKQKGVLPKSEIELQKLPGIGSATASAIMAFVYNKPTVYLETNVRAVYLHEFFPNTEQIHDRELLPLIMQTLPKKQIRDWYYALLDYGVYIKQTFSNPNRRSKSYTKQSKFRGSKRELRGSILKQLLVAPKTLIELRNLYHGSGYDVEELLQVLVFEKLIVYQNKKYKLA